MASVCIFERLCGKAQAVEGSERELQIYVRNPAQSVCPGLLQEVRSPEAGGAMEWMSAGDGLRSAYGLFLLPHSQTNEFL